MFVNKLKIAEVRFKVKSLKPAEHHGGQLVETRLQNVSLMPEQPMQGAMLFAWNPENGQSLTKMLPALCFPPRCFSSISQVGLFIIVLIYNADFR